MIGISKSFIGILKSFVVGMVEGFLVMTVILLIGAILF